MFSRSLIVKALPGVVLATLAAGYAFYHFNNQLSAAKLEAVDQYVAVDVKEQLRDKSSEVGRLLSSVYENARMISLLPGMRAIHSENRHNDQEDIVATGKLSAHDYDTVQQIYNNLASNVSVSEVYAVMDGFDASQGEIPFFMFDSLIVGGGVQAEAGEEVATADTPEESEAAEYAYYPTQLALLKSRFPTFTFTSLEQIPVIASPSMRTCDNTQFPSISKSDVHDSYGILFSVPFYNNDKQFSGIISVVVRTNVLEAALVGAPFVIVTPEDAERAAQENVSAPPVSSLVLTNKLYGLTIADRRNAGVEEKIKDISQVDKRVFTVAVPSPTGMQWDLSYYLSPAETLAIETRVWKEYQVTFAVIGLLYLIALVSTGFIANMRLSNRRLNTMLDSVNVAQQQLQDTMAATEREAAANRRIRQGLDYCNTGVMIADADMNILYCNEAAQALMTRRQSQLARAIAGFSAANIVNSPVFKLHPDPQQFKSLIASMKQAQTLRVTLGELSFDITAAPIFSDDNQRIGTTFEWSDITELLREQGLEALRQQEDAKKLEEERRLGEENFRIRQALDSVSTGTLIADSQLNIIYINDAAKRSMQNAEVDIRQSIYGFSANDVLGKPIDIFQQPRSLLSQLNQTYSTEIVFGARTFRFVANPISSNGSRIGTVVEWSDRTSEISIEKQIDQMVTASSRGDFSQRIETRSLEGFFKVLGDGLNRVSSTTADALDDISIMLSALAQGDISKRIARDYAGQFARLKDDANTTAETLAETVGQINESVFALQAGIAEVASGMADLNRRTTEQASALQQTASSMEEMTSTIKQSAGNTKKANLLVLTTKDKAEHGTEVVKRAIVSMQEISTASQRIANITNIINEIAFQTNLLALNAAVEAARAGEQGRGFAVVATEVRSLAQRSANASREIRELIQDSQVKVDDGVGLVNQTGETLMTIALSVKQANDLMSELATAAAEQSVGIVQIGQAIDRMDKMTNQNAALAEQATTAANNMAAQASQAMDAVAFFKV